MASQPKPVAPDRSPIPIRNFGKERYLDAGYMQRETALLWRRSWLFAGLASDVAAPGQFLTFEIGRESILVTRAADGALRAMHNACTHRGTRLVEEDCGHKGRFVCPYHAWAFANDASLLAAPGAERFSNGVPKEALGLKQVEVGEALGMVFVRIEPGGPGLAAFLAPIHDLVAAYRLEEMTVTDDQSVSHNCNWKAILDNFSELYHVPFLHPMHRRMVECLTAPVELFEHGHTAVYVEGATTDSGFPTPDTPTDILRLQLQGLGLEPADFHGRIPAIRPAIQRAKRHLAAEQGLDYSRFTDAQLSDVWQFNIFPNTILSITSESAWIMASRPHADDPGKSHFDMLTLVRFHGTEDNAAFAARAVGDGGVPMGTHFRLNGPRPADYQRPPRDRFTHADIIAGRKSMTVTINEDISLLGRVQQGMQSSGFDRVWLSDEECRVQHFHDTLDQTLGDA